MKTRKEIETNLQDSFVGVVQPRGTSLQVLQLEVLLDMRDLLKEREEPAPTPVVEELVDLIRNRRHAFIEIDCGCRTTEVLNHLTSSIIEAYEAGNSTPTPVVKDNTVYSYPSGQKASPVVEEIIDSIFSKEWCCEKCMLKAALTTYAEAEEKLAKITKVLGE